MNGTDRALTGASTAPYGRSSPRPAADPVDAMSVLLAQNWWAIALRGAVAIFFAAIALLLPGVTILSLVLLFAAYMLADGVLAIVAAVRAAHRHQRWGALVLEGIADWVAGGIAFVWPFATVIAFVWLLGAWAIVSGSLLTAAAFRLDLTYGRWWMGLGGLASLIWGILLLMWPIVGALVLTWWIAGYALVFGVLLLALAFRLRRRHHQPTAPGAVAQGI